MTLRLPRAPASSPRPPAQHRRRAIAWWATPPTGTPCAFYGREFADVNPVDEDLYQPYWRYQGEHPWPELERDYIDRNGFVRRRDARARAPWLWDPRTHRFISYDDPRSIEAKAAHIEAHRLGGADAPGADARSRRRNGGRDLERAALTFSPAPTSAVSPRRPSCACVQSPVATLRVAGGSSVIGMGTCTFP